MNARRSLFSVVLVVCLIIAGFALAASKSSRIAEERENTGWSARELPHDWVWRKKAVTFDDMYMKR